MGDSHKREITAHGCSTHAALSPSSSHYNNYKFYGAHHTPPRKTTARHSDQTATDDDQRAICRRSISSRTGIAP